MFVRWYIWSFGFCSVAKKYDSQIVLRLTVYRKSMALILILYPGFIFIWSHFGPEKKNLYQNFKSYNVKGFASLGYLTH